MPQDKVEQRVLGPIHCDGGGSRLKQYLRFGFLACLLATLAALFYYYAATGRVSTDVWKNLPSIVPGNVENPPHLQSVTKNANMNQKHTAVIDVEDGYITTLATTTRAACTLDWNPNHLDIQPYESQIRGKYSPPITKENDMLKKKEKQHLELMLPEPKFKLDPVRFLLPILVWGPNNQLVGLRESLFASIKLNRTFVVPKFEKHQSDKQGKNGKFIAPVHRVDVELLCKFVSCVTIKQFREACNKRVDVIMNTRYLKMADIQQIEQKYEMRILPDDVEKSSLPSDLFLPPGRTSENRKMFAFKAHSIEKYFTSSAKCVIFPYPFGNLHTAWKKGFGTNLLRQITYEILTDPNASKDHKLMISILRHTQHPKYLNEMSENFIATVMGDEPFLSVHWRYNKADYLSSRNCAKSSFMSRLCAKAKNFTVEDFANSIRNKVLSLKKKNITVKNIYVATPKSELARILAVAKIISQKEGWKTYTSIELDEVMKSYTGCEFLTRHSDDILSTIEMEICTRGIAFLGSVGTWSGNVQKARLFSEDPRLEKSRDDVFSVW